MRTLIPIAVSARHVHLSPATCERLFGPAYRLRSRKLLSQPGEFAAEETVMLVGPAGALEQVRVVGPPRERDQVEISRSDGFILGIDAPVRISGDLADTPGVTIEGPAGRATLPECVIIARRHIHVGVQDAQRLGLQQGANVEVTVASDSRSLTFGDVIVRIAADFRLELHLDTDEANAAGVRVGHYAELLLADP